MSYNPSHTFPHPAKIIGAAVASGHIPGVVAAAGRGPATLASWVAGQADSTLDHSRAMSADTVFDLASLTKVVATTTATLALAGQGELGLGDPVTRYLPGFVACREGPVTVRHLLTHTAGLPDTRKFFEWCGTRAELLQDLLATPLSAPPGTQVRYSDLGFIALGEIIAAVTGQPLDAAVRRLVTEPLGLASTGFTLAAAADRFAATERRADGSSWTGIVHDENARLMGGIAGHAGLFSTVADLARFAAGGSVRRTVRSPPGCAAPPRPATPPGWAAAAGWAGCAPGTVTTSWAVTGLRRPCRTPASPGPAWLSTRRAAAGSSCWPTACISAGTTQPSSSSAGTCTRR